MWGPCRHKLAWNTLKNPASSGGAALPDFHSYYIAAQLSHFYYIHNTDGAKCQALVCNKPNKNTHSPLQVLFRGGTARRGTGGQGSLLHQHKRIWEIALKLIGADFFHSHTPLWLNPQLKELSSLPGAARLAAKGIVFLHQVITPSGVRDFQSLCVEFQLPMHMLFNFRQMKHALQAQFVDGFPKPQLLSLVGVITGVDPAKLISTLYVVLRACSVAGIIDTVKLRWEEDIGPVDDSDWNEVLENVKKVSPKLPERLTQLYIIHILH